MLTGQILLQLIVILLTVQAAGYLSRLLGQQWVIGEILAGLALGPSFLGAFLPGVEHALFPVSALPTLQTLGDIGLVLYMFSLGASLDTHLMLQQSRGVLVVSLVSILLPLTSGAVVAFFLYPGLAGIHANLATFMLVVGTALSITAFPVLARLLKEKHMLGMRVGMLALTSAAIGDVVAWCLLALVIAIIQAAGIASAALTVGLTVLFIVLMPGVVRPLLAFADRRWQSKQWLVTCSIILLLCSAYVTNEIGIHPIFGAFLMGVILPRKPAFIAQVRSIDQVNSLLFLPLFFVYSGLRTQIGSIHSPNLWLIGLFVLVVACLGKILGGAFSARLIGETWKESLSLGVLMNTRGLVELIVLNIGLDAGVLSPPFFAILVLVALITTMMASPLLFLLGYRQKDVQGNEKDMQVVNQQPVLPG